METFNDDIAEILEVVSVKQEDELSQFECWDSLTILSIIAYANDKYDVTLTAQDINDAKTIAGLEQLIRSKIK